MPKAAETASPATTGGGDAAAQTPTAEQKDSVSPAATGHDASRADTKAQAPVSPVAGEGLTLTAAPKHGKAAAIEP